MKINLRNLLITLITIFALTSALVFTIYEGVKINDIAEKQYIEMVLEIAENQSRNVYTFFNNLNRKLSLIAESSEIINYIESNSKKSIDEIEYQRKTVQLLTNYTQNDDKNDFAITGKNNQVLISTNADLRNYINESDIEENTFFIYADGSNGQYRFVYKKALDLDYHIIGVFDNRHIEEMFSRSKFSANGRVILIDPQNQLIDNSYIGNLLEINIPEYREFKSHIILNNFDENIKQFKYEMVSKERNGYLTSLNNTGWKLGVIVEADMAFIHSNAAFANMLNCVILTGLILITIGVLIIIPLTKPLYIIKTYIKKIELGDYSNENRMNMDSKNEFGLIISAFDKLLDNFNINESRYKAILNMSENIIFEWNFSNDNIKFSDNFNKKFSYQPSTDSFADSFLNKCTVHPEDAECYKNDLDNLKVGNNIQKGEYRIKNIFGDYIWILVQTNVIKNADRIKIIGVLTDIDTIKKNEENLQNRLNYDALTELYNRETLEYFIRSMIKNANKDGFAVLLIDIDDFTRYNDNYSHATGDQVLKFAAKAIQDTVSEYGFAGRYGGDEIVVCIRNAKTNDPARTARNILNRLKEGFLSDLNEKFSVSASIGIMVVYDSKRPVNVIIKAANEAMHKVKNNGKSNYGFYEK